jgi:hypothetical protein
MNHNAYTPNFDQTPMWDEQYDEHDHSQRENANITYKATTPWPAEDEVFEDDTELYAALKGEEAPQTIGEWIGMALAKQKNEAIVAAIEDCFKRGLAERRAQQSILANAEVQAAIAEIGTVLEGDPRFTSVGIVQRQARKSSPKG